MRFDPNPGINRVLIIGALIFLEALLVNILVVLQQGRFLTQVELFTVICMALLQVVTYFLGFLRKEE